MAVHGRHRVTMPRLLWRGHPRWESDSRRASARVFSGTAVLTPSRRPPVLLRRRDRDGERSTPNPDLSGHADDSRARAEEPVSNHAGESLVSGDVVFLSVGIRVRGLKWICLSRHLTP